jgi:hypothetical protein
MHPPQCPKRAVSTGRTTRHCAVPTPLPRIAKMRPAMAVDRSHPRSARRALPDRAGWGRLTAQLDRRGRGSRPRRSGGLIARLRRPGWCSASRGTVVARVRRAGWLGFAAHGGGSGSPGGVVARLRGARWWLRFAGHGGGSGSPGGVVARLSQAGGRPALTGRVVAGSDRQGGRMAGSRHGDHPSGSGGRQAFGNDAYLPRDLRGRATVEVHPLPPACGRGQGPVKRMASISMSKSRSGTGSVVRTGRWSPLMYSA